MMSTVTHTLWSLDGVNGVEPPELDVSKLPENGFDWHAPLWWGNLLMLIVETTTMALLLATYFYVMPNEQKWPPPQVNDLPFMYDTAPGLTAGTINMVLLILSCPLMWIVDQWARRDQGARVMWGLVALGAMAAVSCVLRWYEFKAIHFWWDENAYASTVWTLEGLHFFYIVVGLAEMFLMAAWIGRHGMDAKHALDVTLVGGYWYWVVGIWVITYVTIYWVPRWV
jgi:cytochrome c oxidase subunit III